MMIEAYRGYVNAWECDEMSHMNIQFYMAKASDAAFNMGVALGVGGRDEAAKAASLAPIEHHIRFHREMMVSDLVSVRSGVVDIEDRAFTLYLEMKNALSDALTATFVMRTGHRDHKGGHLSPLRNETRRRAEKLRVELPTEATARALTSDSFDRDISTARADKLGLIVSNRSVCNPWECDANGHMNPRFYMARFSECQGHFWAHIGIGRHSQAEMELATATTEYRLVHFCPLLAGNTILVRTGLFGLTQRTVHYKHWMFDGESGAPVAASEGIALLFNRTTRRAVDFPENLRARMASVLVKS
jgi:acyl-CoA thioester hydrolase